MTPEIVRSLTEGATAYAIIGAVCLFLFDVGGKINFLWRYFFGFACFVTWCFLLGNETQFEIGYNMTQPNFRLAVTSIFIGTVLVWYILIRYYLIVSPILWRISRWQLEHTLRWRDQSYTSTLGKWVTSEELKRIENTCALAKHIPLLESYTRKKWPGHYDEDMRIIENFDPRRWKEDPRRFNPKKVYGKPYQESTQTRQQEQPKEDTRHMDGKINWHEIGKQYKRNKGALNRIIGMEKAKTEIREAIEIPLARPDLVKRFGYKNSGGMILYGPPGNGKTELARAVAEYLGLYFISVKPSDIYGTLTGATEQNISNLFTEAQRHAPAVIFIDELDGLGKSRGTQSMNTERSMTQFLSELDGFNKREGVFVIGATNRLEDLDSAFIRPGRFDKKILVPNPSYEDRLEMFSDWTVKLKLADDVYKIEIVNALDGASGATIRGVTEQMKKLAMRKAFERKNETITRAEVFEIIHEMIGDIHFVD